jgi:hypothetical protein
METDLDSETMCSKIEYWTTDTIPKTLYFLKIYTVVYTTSFSKPVKFNVGAIRRRSYSQPNIKGHGPDSSAGTATSYRLDGPGSISRYFQFLIGTN